MKFLHLIFVLLSVTGFVGRVALSELKPELLSQKWLKIAPHAISGLLILTGIALVFEGHWLSGQYGWIFAKIIMLFAYIGLGIMTFKQQGMAKWLTFAAALLCVAYIGMVAVYKDAWFFL
ncbi:MAG: SirB2 family protein [Methylococcaceae bacterium]